VVRLLPDHAESTLPTSGWDRLRNPQALESEDSLHVAVIDKQTHQDKGWHCCIGRPDLFHLACSRGRCERPGAGLWLLVLPGDPALMVLTREDLRRWFAAMG